MTGGRARPEYYIYNDGIEAVHTKIEPGTSRRQNHGKRGPRGGGHTIHKDVHRDCGVMSAPPGEIGRPGREVKITIFTIRSPIHQWLFSGSHHMFRRS